MAAESGLQRDFVKNPPTLIDLTFVILVFTFVIWLTSTVLSEGDFVSRVNMNQKSDQDSLFASMVSEPFQVSSNLRGVFFPSSEGVSMAAFKIGTSKAKRTDMVFSFKTRNPKKSLGFFRQHFIFDLDFFNFCPPKMELSELLVRCFDEFGHQSSQGLLLKGRVDWLASAFERVVW